MQEPETLEASVDQEEHYYSDERDERVKETGEVFTPTELVNKMLDELGVDWDNIPKDKKFLDPTCGSGNFLVQLAKRGVPVSSLFGVDLMEDNIKTTKKRLIEVYGDSKDVRFHLERNILERDAMSYSYDFYEEEKWDLW